MKLLFGLGGVLSLIFVTLALFKLWVVARFGIDVAICIWAFACALGVSFGSYALNLRNRIAVLEKQISECE